MYKGIITPMVTPFKRDEQQSIHYEAADQMIEHLIEKGVNGLFLLGTNGEFHTVSLEERIEFTKYCIDKVNHRIPVFSGVGSCNLQEALSMAKQLEETGVDALSVLPPFFVKPKDDDIVEYFKTIAQAVNIPVILYNIPKNVGYPLSSDVFKECLSIENIIGIKDSSGDMEALKQFIKMAKEKGKDVWVGSDSKISNAHELGAIGAIAGTSNLITDCVVELFKALEENNTELAQTRQKDIDVLRAELPKEAVPAILKRSIELAGIAEVGPARLPVKDIKGLYDDELKEMLRYYGLV